MSDDQKRHEFIQKQVSEIALLPPAQLRDEIYGLLSEHVWDDTGIDDALAEEAKEDKPVVKSKHFTQDQIEKYLEKEGGQCPECQSKNIEGSQFDFNDGMVYQNVVCKDCKAEWQDHYYLVNAEPIQS